MTTRAGRHWATCLALAGACSALLVWQRSEAALTDAVDNAGNSWSSARLSIGTDLQLPMFSVANTAPGHPLARCVRITYTGDVPATVRMYTTPGSYTGDIAEFLDLTVEEGSGGSADSCAGFVPASAYQDTLARFVTGHTNFATGFGEFAPEGPASITYRLTVTVRDDPGGQDRAGRVSFTWEAQNT